MPDHASPTALLTIQASGVGRWGGAHGFRRECSEIFGVEQVTSGNARFIQDGREYPGPGCRASVRQTLRQVFEGFLESVYLLDLLRVRKRGLGQSIHPAPGDIRSHPVAKGRAPPCPFLGAFDPGDLVGGRQGEIPEPFVRGSLVEPCGGQGFFRCVRF